MQDGAVSSGCSAMPNSRLKTMRDEFLTSIDYYDGFHVNLLFDHFFINRCAHIWVKSAGGCFEHSYFLLGPLIFAYEYEALGELKKDSILGIGIRLRIVLFEIHLK